jgi:hypothetical protein
MYLIRDLAPIQNAFDGAAPRKVEEVMRERYPDATIDCNGRAHAPYDGYVDAVDGGVYRGGEYLPFEPDADDEASPGRGKYQPAIALRLNGGDLILEGTRGQVAAARVIAKEQQAAHDRNAQHVGAVKARSLFDLELTATFVDFGEWGQIITHYLRDAAGNPVVYKGSARLSAKIGETIRVKATVKSHWTAGDGRKATYINRPVVC